MENRDARADAVRRVAEALCAEGSPLDEVRWEQPTADGLVWLIGAKVDGQRITVIVRSHLG